MKLRPRGNGGLKCKLQRWFPRVPPVISKKFAVSRCWKPRKKACWRSVGASTATRTRRTSSSPAICAWLPSLPWIKAAIQEYILRSWSLVKMGTTANQKKLFFNLRKAKNKISALEEGDLRPDQVKLIAQRLSVTEQDVVDMNRRLGGDVSLNAPIGDDGNSGQWQDWLVDEASDQETRLAESEQLENRQKALGEALAVLAKRERRIFEARQLADDPMTLEDLAVEFGISRERVRQIEVRAFQKVQRAVHIAIAGRRPSFAIH